MSVFKQRPCWHSKKHRRLLLLSFSKTRCCAPSTPSASQSSPRTCGWLGEFAEARRITNTFIVIIELQVEMGSSNCQIGELPAARGCGRGGVVTLRSIANGPQRRLFVSNLENLDFPHSTRHRRQHVASAACSLEYRTPVALGPRRVAGATRRVVTHSVRTPPSCRRTLWRRPRSRIAQ